MEARRFCFLYNFCHHAGQRARRIPVYLHQRRADPCVFIHYSDSNIREKTLLEAMRSPLFLAYHDGQPFNDNMLRPCPMLENPEKLRKIVADSGAHSTDPMSPETTEHLCSKCDGYAACWTPVAEQLWRGSPDEARYLAKQAAAAAKKK